MEEVLRRGIGRHESALVGRSAPFTVWIRTAAALLVLLSLVPAGSRSEVTSQVLYQSVGFSPGSPYSRPLGIFFDRSSRECYVADTGNHQIVVCDERGTPIYRFQHWISQGGEKKLGEPSSLVVDHDGRVFVVDGMVDYIDVLDHMGRTVGTIHPPKDACGETARFKSLALGPNEEVYAALSCGEHRVVVIDSGFEIDRVISLEKPEPEPGCISGLAVDDSSEIYVTDPCADTMVQVYDASGKFERGFGRHSTGFENFSFPVAIGVMSNGTIWVLDSIRQVASCFSKEGEYLAYIGGRGTQPGAFDFPSALTSDGNDLLFVLERVGNRYQCFRLSAGE